MTHQPLTFLFTDLVDHTPLWEQFPDAMRSALARQVELLRAAVENYRGTMEQATAYALGKPHA
jgi:class 3 adenylate cyclase